MKNQYQPAQPGKTLLLTTNEIFKLAYDVKASRETIKMMLYQRHMAMDKAIEVVDRFLEQYYAEN